MSKNKNKNTTPFDDHRYYLLKAIQRCDSQEKLGERTGFSRQKINFLLNRAQKVRCEQAWEIAEATGHEVKWHQLASHLPQGLKKELLAADSRTHPLSISERIEGGMAYEAELRRQPAGTVKGRIEAIAAQEMGFGNYQTYRQAKRMKLWGIPELVVAMDLKKLKI